jgi:transposase
LVAARPDTRAYIERRVGEGKSRRESTRLLKRYLARQLYRVLQQTEPLTT